MSRIGLLPHPPQQAANPPACGSFEGVLPRFEASAVSDRASGRVACEGRRPWRSDASGRRPWRSPWCLQCHPAREGWRRPQFPETPNGYFVGYRTWFVFRDACVPSFKSGTSLSAAAAFFQRQLHCSRLLPEAVCCGAVDAAFLSSFNLSDVRIYFGLRVAS